MMPKQQGQHRHEMAFAAAEAAMQIGAFAGVGLQGTLDEQQGAVETDRQLRRHDIGAQGVVRPRDSLGQA
jgi:hypothetical protein